MFSSTNGQQQQQRPRQDGQQQLQLQQGFGILPASASTATTQHYPQSASTAAPATPITSTAHPSLTLNFDDDNDLLRSSPCDSPKFTPPSPATTASTTTSAGLECSSLSDSGYSTSASSNVSSSLSPLPTTPLPASPLSTTATTTTASGALPPPTAPNGGGQGPSRSTSEKLEAENAVLTNACLGLLELLNSQRGGNPGAATAAYNALLSRVSATVPGASSAAATTSSTSNNVSTPSLTPCDATSTFSATGATTSSSSSAYPAMATNPATTAPQPPQYGGLPINRQQQEPQMQPQQQQQQPTLAAPMPAFSFPGATTGMPRPQVGASRLNDLSSNSNTNMSCYGRRKSYGAPPGVWRNPYGYVSTVYVNKKRVYGPLRKTIEDASRDREAMVQAKEYVTSVEEMRAFVREFLKPNPHGGVAESAVLPNLPALEDEMLVTL
ncbi:Intraflagellar transport protein 56 [Perkinsus olseni]|uniref:Intraflagellar transport protein 56 n=1 Tax=Perkinsus olseni TaxID=32597 RepID=A0A7J6NEF7_PEROL|nr:Intraflagellar transport protein 56 [Perkinsus olseni]